MADLATNLTVEALRYPRSSDTTVVPMAPPNLARKLHLGCGAKYIPGFYHVDIVDAPHIDRCGHVDDLAFLADGVVELIYACHVLEHFGRYEAATRARSG